MDDKLKDEIHIIDGKYVLVRKEIFKTLHPTEAGGLVNLGKAHDMTNTIDRKDGLMSNF